MLSSFTQVVPNLYEFLCSAEHKGNILKNVVNRAVLDHSIFFLLVEVNGAPKTAWLQTFFKISSFVFRTNTFIQVWNYLRVNK